MHADRPGDRPRLLYWYRTAPGITLGRSPLDEDAIRTIEEQHPDIEFDWPAILALSEVMTPEDEAPAKPQQRDREPRRERRPKGRDRESATFAGEQSGQLRPDDRAQDPPGPVGPEGAAEPITDDEVFAAASEPEAVSPQLESPRSTGLVDQLAGREIASRLRGRYAEITMRIRGEGDRTRDALMKRAEALDPDRWDTPEAVLQGVSNADALFEQLRAALHSSRE